MEEILAALEKEQPDALKTPADALAQPAGEEGGEEAPLAGQEEVLAVLTTSAERARDTENKLPQWAEYAEKHLDSFLVMLVDDDTTSGVADALKGTAFCKKTGDTESGQNHIGIWYDCKMAGESSSYPHSRPPAFQAGHLRRLVAACCQARGLEEELSPGDLYLIMDAGKHGNESSFNSAFVRIDDEGKSQTMKKEKYTYFVTYEEDGLADRKGLVRGAAALQQVEFLHVYAAHPLQLQKRQRLHYQFSNLGNSIGPVAAPPSAGFSVARGPCVGPCLRSCPSRFGGCATGSTPGAFVRHNVAVAAGDQEEGVRQAEGARRRSRANTWVVEAYVRGRAGASVLAQLAR